MGVTNIFSGDGTVGMKNLLTEDFCSLVAVILSLVWWGWWEVFLCGLLRFPVSSVIVCVHSLVQTLWHCSL